MSLSNELAQTGYTTALAILLPISTVIFSLFGKFAFDIRRKPLAAWGWAFAATLPTLISTLYISAFTELPVRIRNIVSGGFGAVTGCILALWLGYWIAAARSDTTIMTQTHSETNMTRAPTVNQGEGSAYSKGQTGGVTVGTVNTDHARGNLNESGNYLGDNVYLLTIKRTISVCDSASKLNTAATND
jgi:hypothetical protein